MLGVIVQHSVEIVTFISWLSPALYQPQIRHLIRLVDALLVCDSQKTLTNLYRQLAAKYDPKTAADFFRESPWQVVDVSGPRKRWMLLKFLKLAHMLHLDPVILIGVDDSLGKKHKDTRHLEAVSFHHNHTDSTRRKQVFSNGYVYVEIHIQIGPIGFLFDTRLYLREKTVRQLNRQRSKDNRLRFRTKYALAREMLVELSQLLPKGYRVYVLFDSWYASAKLIKLCRRQRWHVICAVKSNRRLNRTRMDHHNQSLRNKRYQRVTLQALDPSRPSQTYCVRTVQGHLEEVADEVCGIISKRHPGDKHPKYFVCVSTARMWPGLLHEGPAVVPGVAPASRIGRTGAGLTCGACAHRPTQQCPDDGHERADAAGDLPGPGFPVAGRPRCRCLLYTSPSPRDS